MMLISEGSTNQALFFICNTIAITFSCLPACRAKVMQIKGITEVTILRGLAFGFPALEAGILISERVINTQTTANV